MVVWTSLNIHVVVEYTCSRKLCPFSWNSCEIDVVYIFFIFWLLQVLIWNHLYYYEVLKFSIQPMLLVMSKLLTISVSSSLCSHVLKFYLVPWKEFLLLQLFLFIISRPAFGFLFTFLDEFQYVLILFFFIYLQIENFSMR